MTKIGLVGCTKSKLNRRATARDLYSPSAMFRGRVAYVERTCDEWLILSAKYGVVRPTDELDPYDVTLVGASTTVKKEWAKGVLGEIAARFGDLRSAHFEIHAGRDYWGLGLAEGLLHAGAEVVIPAAGLSQGQQLRFYKLADAEMDDHEDDEEKDDENETERRRRVAQRFVWGAGDIQPVVPPGSPQQNAKRKYAPLYNLLSRSEEPAVRLTFMGLEKLLGVPLPDSARNHRAWWANTPSNYHAKAWLDPGWWVDEVDLSAESVVFAKH